MKFPKKPLGKTLYGVASFGGIVTNYFGDSYKDCEDAFFKSHTATHMYKLVGSVKEVIKENHRRNTHPGAIALAFGKKSYS